jgi:hypothetical protein
VPVLPDSPSKNPAASHSPRGELNLLVSGLVVFEREQLRLANLAQEEGSTLEAEMRRMGASKIKQLAEKKSPARQILDSM